MSKLIYMQADDGVWYYGYKVGTTPPALTTTGSKEWPNGPSHDERVKKVGNHVEYFYDHSTTAPPTKQKELPIMIKPLDLTEFIKPLDLSQFTTPVQQVEQFVQDTATADDAITTLVPAPAVQGLIKALDLGDWSPEASLKRYESTPVEFPHGDRIPGGKRVHRVRDADLAQLTPEQLQAIRTPDPIPAFVAPVLPSNDIPPLTEAFEKVADQLTGWNSYPDVPPTIEGYYEVRCILIVKGGTFSAFSKWTGKEFAHNDKDVMVFAWRGLTEEGYKLLKGE